MMLSLLISKVVTCYQGIVAQELGEWRCVCGCGLSILEILNVVVVCVCWNAQSLAYVARTLKMIARTLLRWSRWSEDASLLPFWGHSQHGFKTWDLRTTWVFLSIDHSSSWLSSWSPQIWTAQIHVVIKMAVITPPPLKPTKLCIGNPREWGVGFSVVDLLTLEIYSQWW